MNSKQWRSCRFAIDAVERPASDAAFSSSRVEFGASDPFYAFNSAFCVRIVPPGVKTKAGVPYPFVFPPEFCRFRLCSRFRLT